MMPNITRGSRMGGLMAYLAGPGRRNEHEDPHLVAGNDAMMMWHADTQLDRNSALTVARHLNRPHTAFGTEVKGGHVWHCSLAINVEEGVLSDDKWRDISQAMIHKMGFDNAEGTKASMRWVAVRHGVCQNGNDHVHLVVNLVREDGTKGSIHHDFKRAQQASREIEREFGLRELNVNKGERASVGYQPGEIEAESRRRARAQFEQQRRSGDEKREWNDLSSAERHARIEAQQRADQPRWNLARKVRAAATSAEDEAEFVRRMRRQGVLVRARYAEGTTDVVTGYSVAQRPEFGERPIWFGGGSLARDLTLPRLRQDWRDDPGAAIEAAAEWNAAKRNRAPVAPGREMHEPDPQLWHEASRDLEKLREHMRSVPVDDLDTWARVARETSGAFAAWSQRVEDTPGPLAATSDALAQSAHTRRSRVRPEHTPSVSVAGTAMLLSSVATTKKPSVAQALILRQLANLAKAVTDMNRAVEDARRAQVIETAVRTQLVDVSQRMPSIEQRAQERDFREHIDRALAQQSQPREQPRRIVQPTDLEKAKQPAARPQDARPGVEK